MPPKPWETKGVQPAHNISEIIQSNPTLKEQLPVVNNNNANTNDPSSTNRPLGTSLSSGLGGYGSGMGSYGGMGSGLGRMYGGGMGGMYGGGMGGMGGMYGGMGGMGMMGGMGGMGMGMQQNGTLMNSMIALQSFGFLINSLSDIARSMDQNYEGLQLFKNSFKSLSSKVQNGVKDGVVGAGRTSKSFLFSILQFIKTYILCLGTNSDKSKLRSIRIMMALSAFILIVSFYPYVMRLLKLKK